MLLHLPSSAVTSVKCLAHIQMFLGNIRQPYAHTKCAVSVPIWQVYKSVWEAVFLYDVHSYSFFHLHLKTLGWWDQWYPLSWGPPWKVQRQVASAMCEMLQIQEAFLTASTYIALHCFGWILMPAEEWSDVRTISFKNI